MTDSQHPPHWPDVVRDVFDDALAVSPDLAGPAFSSLVESCELLATAYALDKVAAGAGYVSTGSTGQTIVHPATVEARLTRTEAAKILARLIPAKNRGQRIARARHGGMR
jgi:hypothetical protein